MKIQDANITPKISSPSAHHRTTLSSYRPIFAIKACIDNGNKNSSGDENSERELFTQCARKLPRIR